jgi:phosphohistidine phosphatase
MEVHMQLYFLRHGLADWPDWDEAQDHLRPLTKEGLKKMKAEAKALARLRLHFDAILSSPYTRALQTADIVAGVLGQEVIEEHRLAPGFNLERLGEIVARFPTAKALLVVGHEPAFSATITALIGGGRITLKKGGLARVEITSFEPLSGDLIWLTAPKILAN